MSMRPGLVVEARHLPRHPCSARVRGERTQLLIEAPAPKTPDNSSPSPPAKASLLAPPCSPGRTRLEKPAPPTARRSVNWRLVVAAGGVAWLLVAGLIGATWAFSTPTQKTRLAISLAPPPVERPLPEPRPFPERRVPKPQIPPESDPPGQVPPASFKKPPASPALPEPDEPAVKLPALPESEVVRVNEAAVQEAEACGKNGTKVNFVGDPAEAARLAAKNNKLMFVIHLSGNFEDPSLT